ncbi:MAG: GldG family protein [Planctomycetes bacterium]|nr:GldG family protein [Planctomycetota bacterium]
MANVLKHRAAIWTNVGVSLLLALAGVVLINIVANRFQVAWDWTTTGEFTLHNHTKQVLRTLPTDSTVTAVAFFLPVPPDPRMGVFHAEVVGRTRQMLELYKAEAGDRLRVEFVDPYRDRDRAEQLKKELGISLESQDQDMVILRYRNAEERLKLLEDLGVPEFVSGYGEARMKSFIGEAALTTALMKVTTGEAKEILWITGHGETVGAPPSENPEERQRYAPEGFDAMRRYLTENEGIRIRDELLQSLTEIPKETHLVVIANPKTPYLEGEVGMLRSYLDGGGRLLLLLEPFPVRGASPQSLGLNPLLEPWGLRILPGVVWERERRLRQNYPWEFLGIDFNDFHPVTQAFAMMRRRQEIHPILVREAIGLEVLTEGRPAGVTPMSVLGTTPQGLLKVDFASGEINRSVDREGAQPLLAVSEKIIQDLPAEDAAEDAASLKEAIKTRLVVFADAGMATNELLQNEDHQFLALSAVNWLLDRESRIGIRAAERSTSRVNIGDEQLGRLWWKLVIFMPGSGLLLGLVMWWIRRGE